MLFLQGFVYEEIRRFLSKCHGEEVGLSTLKQCVKQLGLCLQINGMRVQRMIIEQLASELDPAGVQERKAHP